MQGDAAVSRSLSQGAGVIRLLGPFSFDLEGASESDEAVWRRAHARRLVQMVGSSPRQTESRANVLQALWPEFDEARARNRLHHTVHWIRKGLERLPAAVRPLFVVSADRVELVLAPGTCTDVQVFLDALDRDSDDDAARLDSLEQALSWYRGPLAPDWAELGDIAARRAWLDGRFADALGEAVELAESLGALDAATKHAQRRAQHLQGDVQAQCIYMKLLARQGRAEAALVHGQTFRNNATELDAASHAALDAVVREVQQQVNRAAAGPVLAAEYRPTAAGVSRLPALRPVLGYGELQRLALQALMDPFSSLVSLVGPPGAGKSVLALAVAHRLFDSFGHGVCWVEAHGAAASQGWEAAIARALGLAPGVELVEALRSKELLLVLDGLSLGPEELPRLAELVAASKDSRWLVTATTFLQLRGEKVLVVEPSLLLKDGREDDSASPAAQLLAQGQHGWSLADKRIRGSVESVARALDGLPILLDRASWAMQTLWPSELLARLARDPATLLRSPGAHTDPVVAGSDPALTCHDAALSSGDTEALQRWLRQAPVNLLQLLLVAAPCRSWLSRDDLLCLGEGIGLTSVEGLVDLGVRFHYLQRRVRDGHETTWSEFRVPRYVAAALSLIDDAQAGPQTQVALAHWLSQGLRSSMGETTAGIAQAVRWLDDHIEDMDYLVERWLELGRQEDVARLCLSHASSWVRSAHAQRVLGWLSGLGEQAEGLPDALAARLLVERAQLHAHLGQLHAAFEDASRALARLTQQPDVALRQQAMRLLERYGTAGATTKRWRQGLDLRGIEAGESLLHVALITARSGALPKALQLCSEAVGVFTYFGLTRGLLKAHQHRSMIAYAMGNTDVAWQCALQAERTSRVIGDEVEALRAELLRARVLLTNLQVGQAIELASKVMADPKVNDHPPLLGRGLLLLGWAQYALGAYPIVRALCKELRDLVDREALNDLVDQVEMLGALVDARQGRQAAAMRRLFRVLEPQPRGGPIHDRQADLVNAADLVLQLGRPDLAAKLLETLRAFGSQPDHALRPWVAERMKGLQRQMQDDATVCAAPAVDAHATEQLLKLVSGLV